MYKLDIKKHYDYSEFVLLKEDMVLEVLSYSTKLGFRTSEGFVSEEDVDASLRDSIFKGTL